MLAAKSFLDDDPSPDLLFQPVRFQCMLALFDESKLIPNGPNNGPNLYTRYFGYSELSLRDFAALKLAGELDIDIPWKKGRTPAEWSKIRDRVRIAAEKEIAKK